MKKKSYYIDDCMRCKKKMSQERARQCNHCPECLITVSAKWDEATIKIEEIRKEAADFSRGEDLN